MADCEICGAGISAHPRRLADGRFACWSCERVEGTRLDMAMTYNHAHLAPREVENAINRMAGRASIFCSRCGGDGGATGNCPRCGGNGLEPNS